MTNAGMNRELVIEQILNAVNATQKDTNRWEGLCPAHNDHNPSLGIYINPDGYIGFKCFSRNCKHEDIVKAIKDKFNIVVPGKRHTGTSSKVFESKVLYPAHESEFPFRLRREEDTLYEYFMANGELAFVVQRFLDNKGKRQIIPWFSKEFVSEIGRSEKSWEAKDPPRTGRPIFNLHLLEHYKNKPVLIVEGEKTALAAMQMKEFEGYVITTWSGGSQNVRMSDWQVLRERDTPIYLWPDYDDVGMKAMKEVAKFITTGEEDNRLNILSFSNLISARIAKGWDLADGFNNSECSYAFEDFEFHPYHVDDKLISSTLEEAMAERDKHLRKLHHGTRDYIINLKYKANSSPFNYMIFSDIKSLTSADNEKSTIEIGDKVKTVYVVEEWFYSRNEGHPTYLNGVVFDPTTEALEVINKDGTRSLNTFSGFPKFEGEDVRLINIFLEHLDNMIEDKGVIEWMLDYLAHMFQYPGIKPGTALLLLGHQGVGKSVIIKVLNKLLGDLSKILTRDLANNNISLTNSILVYHDEWSIDFHKDRIYYDHLKNVIDTPKIRVSEKYIQPWEASSFCRFIFTSNSMTEVKFPSDDRRFTVVECNNHWLGNNDHFITFFHLMNNEAALASLLKFFKERKIQHNLSFNYHTTIKEDLWVPENKLLAELVSWANGNGLPLEIYDALGPIADRFGEEPILLPRKIMADYMPKILGRGNYGNLEIKMLKKIMPSSENKRHVSIFNFKGGEAAHYGRCFLIPELGIFRENIEKELERKYPWADKVLAPEPNERSDANVVRFKKDDGVL